MAPIHRAARKGDVAALRRILAGGVSPEVLDGHGHTPLLNLCRAEGNVDEGDRVACFELLREAGANLEAKAGGDPFGSAAIHHASNTGSPVVLSLLLEAGVNVNVTNDGGYTPLHWAARGGLRRTECVELLLKAGAAVNVVSTGGFTPFDIALDNGNRRAYPLFLRAGAEFRYYTPNQNPYTLRVQGAGGFKKYAQNHLARITAILAPTPLLPPELVRKILEFWLHAGYY